MHLKPLHLLLALSFFLFDLVLSLPLSGYYDAIDNSSSLPALLAQSYDYIIVGGGNSGLALASRLSSTPSLTILVLEAGTRQISNPGIYIPGLAGSTFQSPIDWSFFTEPQENANGRSVYWPRGKVLGGSTALNFMAWSRGHATEYNSWSSLGNGAGWSWSSLLPFFKQSEKLTPPGPNTQSVTREYIPSVHGTTGPVDASYPPYISEQFTGFFSGLRSLFLPVDKDLNDGSLFGVSWSASSIVPGQWTRETSETAYVTPVISSRTNLVILTSAQATKIDWSGTTVGGLVVANGVEFVAADELGTILSATANKEVILSAGSIQSPQLLELSGVGDPTILNPLGISTVVSLPGVGNNLQDHPAVVSVYKLKQGYESLDGLAGEALNEALADYAAGRGILTQALPTLAYLLPSSFLSPLNLLRASTLIASRGPFLPLKQWLETMKQYAAGAPIVELLPINVFFGATTPEEGVKYVSLATCLQKSFSRGSIHITSSDPLARPAIDPNYLQHPADLFFLSRAAQFIRRLASTPSFSKYLAEEDEPGVEVQSDGEWEEWVRGGVRTEYHPVGTASMLPRGDDGVVNNKLLVYGTSNVRVVDLSIVPLHISAHPASVAYAIAEKAATLILS